MIHCAAAKRRRKTRLPQLLCMRSRRNYYLTSGGGRGPGPGSQEAVAVVLRLRLRICVLRYDPQQR